MKLGSNHSASYYISLEFLLNNFGRHTEIWIFDSSLAVEEEALLSGFFLLIESLLVHHD